MSYLWILLGYLLTLIGTFTIRGVNLYLLINDLATEYYKIDFDEMYESNEIYDFNLKRIDYESFIPIYNVIKATLSLIDYNKYCGDIISYLDGIFVVQPMAKFEQYEYLQNPSFINLIKVLKNGSKRLENANYFEVLDNDGFSEGNVKYEGENDITILDTSGIFNKMPTSEITEIIKTNDGKHQFDNFYHDNGKKKIFVTKDEEVKNKIEEVKELKNDYKISKLKELKEYLLLLKNKPKKEEKGKQKSIGSKRNN